MKKISILLSFILLNSLIVSYSQSIISLEDITSGVYRPKGTMQTLSSEDGQFFFRLADSNSMIIKYSYRTGLPVDTVLDLEQSQGVKITSFQGFTFSPDEKKILLYNESQSIYRRSFLAQYYWYDISSNTVFRLSSDSQKQSCPLFSPNSKMLAYVLNNNIWLYDFNTQQHLQVTTDGAINKIINGATDWVYEEEFSTTSIMSFSPNSDYLAFVRFDESSVKEFFYQTFKGQLYTEMNIFKYPKAGEDNSVVICKIYDIKSKKTETVHLSSDNIEYIPRIDFVSDNNLAIMTLNRNQNDFKMYYYNPLTRNSQLIFEEKNRRYIYYDFIQSIRFIPEGFFYISERDGYSHIYLYNSDGSLNRQLTKGNYDITQILGYNPDSKTLFYQAADTSPLERNIFKYDLKKGMGTKLSKKAGYNSAIFSNNGHYFINSWSDIDTPNSITLNSADSGAEIRVLENNQDLLSKLSLIYRPSTEFIRVQGADGIDLNGYIMKPRDFDPSKKYPLLMTQYSGPNSQQVFNQFKIDWTDYLVSLGYLVVCVDGRGTGARGEDFRKCTYLNLGIAESDDQITVAKYLATLPYVDANNISIWGWSFGGYNVLMSLSRSEGVFKNGIAIAPVTDWRFYDSVYTERYMQTPQNNVGGYDAGSPIKLANKLSGDLLLIHGSADDNVHFQNTMEYTTSLIENEKQFEMFVFPDLNHSILGTKNRSYLYKKIIDFLKNNNSNNQGNN